MEPTGEFNAFLRAVEGLSAATARNYAGDVLRFLIWLDRTQPDTSLSEVTPTQVRRYVVWMQDQEKTASTRRGAIYALRRYFDYAISQGLAETNPAKLVPAVRADRPDIRPFTRTEVMRMEQALRKDPSPRGRLAYAVVTTLRYTGLRSGEVRGLITDRVDLDHRRLRVLGKGGKPRAVPIPRPLTAVLVPYLSEVRPSLPASPWLFPNPDVRCGSATRQFSAASIARITERAATLAGIDGESNPHRWRHTFATEMLRRGADLHTVQRLLGHASISTTTVYLHLVDDDLQDAVDAAFDPEVP